jgi:EAL domain-containing protein (putative c-di-GMP-specific phosphodiesterase class I)
MPKWFFACGERTFGSVKDALLAALDRNEFVLYFQPHVSLANGKIDGAEALIRWQHPDQGLLAPGAFIPFAEEVGLVTKIGAWVMQETARLSRPWRTANPDFHIWFNLSGAEFKDPALLSRLQGLGDDLWGIGVEINESVAMDNVDETLTIMNALHKAGLFIALDDFGTGYTSLQHLKRLPIDVLKIDRVFVAGLPQDKSLVEVLLSIARAFSFATLAEGIETAEQAAALHAVGCEFGQGYFYARPMPADDFSKLVGPVKNS